MKKCRVCGHISEGERRCPVCKTDVSALPEWNTDGIYEDAFDERYKHCKCGHRNKPDAISCERCDAILVRAPIHTGCPERPALCLQISDGRQILIPRNGGLVGRCYLGETELKDDPYVSGKHARIKPHGSGYLLESLASVNGVYVNNCAIEAGRQTPLKQGDKIRLGHTELSVQLSGVSESKKRIVLL